MGNQATALACICGFLLLPTFAPSATPTSGAPARGSDRLTPHTGDLESAQKLALERNTPLLIHIILEGEDQNDAYRDGILPNRDLIQLSAHCVVVIGNNGDHEQTTITEKVDGETRKRRACSVYRMFENCAQHRECWDPIYHAYQEESGELNCPQTILLTPLGKIAWRHNINDPPSAGEVIKALKDAQKKAGKSLTADGLRSVKGYFVAAANAAKALDWPKVWQRNQLILELIEGGVWGEGATSAQADALKKMRDSLASMEESFQPGQVAEAWRALMTFEAATQDTPIAREVAALKKKITRNKDLKEELRAIQTELAAEELEAQAEALLRSDEERRAMKLFKKILGKKYAATRTAERVRQRFGEIK